MKDQFGMDCDWVCDKCGRGEWLMEAPHHVCYIQGETFGVFTIAWYKYWSDRIRRASDEYEATELLSQACGDVLKLAIQYHLDSKGMFAPKDEPDSEVEC